MKSSDKIVSISAILISISTLIVLIFQTRIMREQQRLSVLPHISIYNERTGTPEFQIVMVNNGIGPAFIEAVNIKYDDQDFDQGLTVFLAENADGFDTLKNVLYSDIYRGQMIPAGQKIPLLEVDNSQESSNALSRMLGQLMRKGFDLEIVYASIYGEKWKINGETVAPEKIE